MKVYNHLDEFQQIHNPVVTIGIFDGLHLGHQKILNRLKECAKEINGESVLLSFFPHPRTVLQPEKSDLRLINTLDEKINLLSDLGIDHVIIHPFDLDFANIPAETFVDQILINKIGVKRLVIGYDHHFGKDRKGSFQQLTEESRKFNFDLEEIPAKDIDEVNISSSKIRKALLDGNVTLANTFLGYKYFFRGTVIKGDQIGRKIHFPTANVYIEEKYKLIPAEGVYAVKVLIREKEYSGMLNIGHRPTLPGKEFSIEVHILNFNDDIYGETIKVSLFQRIRNEVRFDDLSSLEKQLNKDRETVKTLFA